MSDGTQYRESYLRIALVIGQGLEHLGCARVQGLLVPTAEVERMSPAEVAHLIVTGPYTSLTSLVFPCDEEIVAC